MNVKCRIQRYSPGQKIPPYTFDTIGEFECNEPEMDYLGEKLYFILVGKCMEMGYTFRFYSSCEDDGYNYNVTVI